MGAVTPSTDRPEIPSGYGVHEDEVGLLAWPDIEGVLARAHLYWLATANGPTPHLIPIHAAFAHNRIFVGGDPAARWYRNLDAQPRIEVGVADGDVQVIFRGIARRRTPTTEVFESITDNLASKYEWNFDEPLELWEVTPETVIAFDVSKFATSPTRFRFEEQP